MSPASRAWSEERISMAGEWRNAWIIGKKPGAQNRNGDTDVGAWIDRIFFIITIKYSLNEYDES
jgi:hypothetical protein